MSASEGVGRLLSPRSIAIVGASDDPTRIGGRPQRLLRERGFEGDVYPVNPRYETTQGLRCYPDVASLPEVDLVIFCVPNSILLSQFQLAAEHGIKAAVVFNGGYAETGEDGAAEQAELTRIADQYGIALAGPNTLGVASFANKAFATFATTLDTLPSVEPGTIALVSQSGGSAFNLLTECQWAGARFSHVIATGNEAGLTFADYLLWLADDPLTHSVIGYLEGVKDGPRFAEALKALQAAGKSVYLLKSGATSRGALAAASHTAQLAGDDAAFDAVFARYGVVRLQTMDDAVDVARALSLEAPLSGIAIATNSGGAAVYLSDVCEQSGVPLAQLSDATNARLAERLPGFASFSNPVDFTAQVLNDPGLLGATLTILDEDPSIDVLLVFLGSMEFLSADLIGTLREAQTTLTSPLVVTWLGVREEVRSTARAAGLRVASDPARVLRGIALARRGLGSGELDAPSQEGHSEEGSSATARAGLDEATTMRLLDGKGLPTPRRHSVGTADEAVAAAADTGYPCVMKVLDPFLPHRARLGAVRVGVSSDDEVREIFADWEGRFEVKSVLVVEQLTAGFELIVGVSADPTFVTRALVGVGGVWATELAETATLVPPYTEAYLAEVVAGISAADAALRELGGTEAMGQLAKVLVSLEQLVVDPENGIIEIECNPAMLVPGRGVVLADALAVRSPVTEGGDDA